MTRDYRKRVEPREKPKKPPVPTWVPFFYGFLLGSVLVAIGWIVLTPPGTELVVRNVRVLISIAFFRKWK